MQELEQQESQNLLSAAGYSNGVRPDFGIYCPAWVFVELGLNPSEGLVYSFFYSATQKNKTPEEVCWQIGTYNFLATMIGCTKRSLINIINSLEKKGLLIKKKSTTNFGSPAANQYCAIVPNSVLATGFAGGYIPADFNPKKQNTSSEGGEKISLPSEKISPGGENTSLGWCKNFTRGGEKISLPSEKISPPTNKIVNKYKYNNKYKSPTSTSTTVESPRVEPVSQQQVVSPQAHQATSQHSEKAKEGNFEKSDSAIQRQNTSQTQSPVQPVSTTRTQSPTPQQSAQPKQPKQPAKPVSASTQQVPAGWYALEEIALRGCDTDTSHAFAMRKYAEWLSRGYTADDIRAAYVRYSQWYAKTFGADKGKALSLASWLKDEGNTCGFTSWLNNEQTNTDVSVKAATADVHRHNTQELETFLDEYDKDTAVLEWAASEGSPQLAKSLSERVKIEMINAKMNRPHWSLPSWERLSQFAKINCREMFEGWVWQHLMGKQCAY